MSEVTDYRDNAAFEAWDIMRSLVLDNERRREVSEKLGLSFGKLRALRRIAECPLPMRSLAAQLNTDPPNLTALVDDLEKLGLAERRSHPTDRRVKLVAVTPKGAALARQAAKILSRPPSGLSSLSPVDLKSIVRVLAKVRNSK